MWWIMRARAAALALALLGGCSRCRCRQGLLIAGQGSKSAPYAVRRTRAQVNVVPVRYAGRAAGCAEVLRVDGVPLIFWPRGEERGAAKQELSEAAELNLDA
ncbi:hypothetical protein F5882DRAFT_54559 [Hyaloscypha sp. PMI_1271]|nr:hypothetical protein F5882DRAFT_54559 [Hyaloscypha sp. PMI_1271]